MSLAGRSALLIGAGGLGGPSAIGLAAAGIGKLTIMDDDFVDPTNLGRQVLFGDADVGRFKAEVAANALRARFPQIQVEPVVRRFGPETSLAGFDVVLDGSDNFPTRFIANDLCVAARVPLIHGAAVRGLGQVLAIVPDGPCLRCVFEGEPPVNGPNCAEAGVLAPLVGLVGSWMAEAAVQILRGEPPPAGMRIIDVFAGRERIAGIGRDPDCRIHATQPAASLRSMAGGIY